MGCEEWKEKEEKKWDSIITKDKRAKEEGTLVGRYIKEPCCDSVAIYEIIREYKKTVKIRVLQVGDNWEIPYWGQETKIDIEYARNNIGYRDRLDEYFTSKKLITRG